MLTLILILLLLFLVLSVFLTAWTIWFQGYIYSEPAKVLPWRAPAASAAVTFYIALWILLVAKSDTKEDHKISTLDDFNASRTNEFKELWITDRNGDELRTDAHYVLAGGERPTFRAEGNPTRVIPSRPDGIKVKEKDQKILFKPDRDEKGNFKVEQIKGVGGTSTQTLKYRDDKGRVMEEGQFGRVTTFSVGWLIANILLNALHLAVWFVVLWLLLQFQWSHALIQACVLWLVTMLFLLKPLFEMVRK